VAIEVNRRYRRDTSRFSFRMFRLFSGQKLESKR